MLAPQPPVMPDVDLFGTLRAQPPIHYAVRRQSHLPARGGGRRAVQRSEAQQLLTRLLDHGYGAGAGERWPLDRTDGGRPYLRGSDAPGISLAHSGSWLACAAAAGRRVGIDIEAAKPRDWVALSDHFLHSAEADWVRAAVGRERDLRAYACWCRKEALLKAVGIGLVVPLTDIAFSPVGDLAVAPEVFSADEWRTATWHIDGAAVIAVAWDAAQTAP